MDNQSLNSALGWAPDRFLRLQGMRQAVVTGAESIKPVFAELAKPAAAADAAQGQGVFGTQLAPNLPTDPLQRQLKRLIWVARALN